MFLAADLEMLADLLVLGKDAFDILVQCSSRSDGEISRTALALCPSAALAHAYRFATPRTGALADCIYCDDALHLYARLGSDAALGLEAWQEILNEVDGIGDKNQNGVLTRQEWMSWITRLCDSSCTPYEISEMHEELAGIVDDLTRAARLNTQVFQRDAKGRVYERDALEDVACCAADAPSSCAAQ